MADQTTSTPPPASTPAPVEKASVGEDFIDIFYTPSSVFARRENAGFWIPMIVVALVIGVLTIANLRALQPIFDGEFQRSTAAAMKANPQLTPEMMEKGRAFGEIAIKVGAFIGPPIAIFFIGLVLWLVGKVVDAKESLKTATMVAAYAYVPRILESLLSGIQGLALDVSKMTSHYQIMFGLARFLNPDGSPVQLALLSRVDVFTIWVTVLLVIGLSVTGKIPRGKAAIAGVIMWIAGGLPALLGALRQAA